MCLGSRIRKEASIVRRHMLVTPGVTNIFGGQYVCIQLHYGRYASIIVGYRLASTGI